jgi:hypothetical protein
MFPHPVSIPARFSLDEILPDKRYLLDLGAVHAAADVTVNGQAVGHVIFSPYQLDITEFVKVGENSLRIKVTPPLRNRLVGKALSGDPEYRQFAGGFFGASKPIPSGLEGPAAIKIDRPINILPGHHLDDGSEGFSSSDLIF